MDINLVTKLQEASPFQPITPEEVEARKNAPRTPYVCPECKKPIDTVIGKASVEDEFNIKGNGELDGVADETSWPEQLMWDYFCPLCNKDISAEVMG